MAPHRIPDMESADAPTGTGHGRRLLVQSRFSYLRVPAIGAALMLFAALGARAAVPLGTTRLSLGAPSLAEPGGAQSDGNSVGTVSMSPDGRFVVFVSNARTLAGEPFPRANLINDVYLRDRQTNSTERISVQASRRLSNGACGQPSVSEDGRFVAFDSVATNLVAPAADGNNVRDVFVRDRRGSTIIVSAAAAAEADRASSQPSISQDGLFVAFQSLATNYTPAADANDASDIYLAELAHASGNFIFLNPTRVIARKRVSVSATNGDPNGPSTLPSISQDGRYVAFQSTATNIVTGDTNMASDVFVRDTVLNRTILISKAGGGEFGDRDSFAPAISATGRFVAFVSGSTNLGPTDNNSVPDVYVHDRDTDGNGIFDEAGKFSTFLVSVAGDGSTGNAPSGIAPGLNPTDGRPAISGDGRFVGFISAASNLVAGDVNATEDIFVRDRLLGTTDRVSVGNGGSEGNGRSVSPAIDDLGSVIAFSSDATNLVNGDTNRLADVFAVQLGNGTSGNDVPQANAGPDVEVLEEQDVELDGSRSTDREDAQNQLQFFWSQVSGTTVVLDDPTAIKPTFVAPHVVTFETLTFQLAVTDTTGQIGVDRVDIDVSQAPPGTLFGTVRTAGGVPVGGATIRAIRDDGASPDPAFSRADGTYVLPGARVGNNVVTVRAPGFEAEAADVVITSGGMVNQDFVVSAPTAMLSGRIQLANGTGLGDADVRLLGDDNRVILATRTDGSGNYRFADLDAATIAVIVTLSATSPRAIPLAASDLGLQAGENNVRNFQYGNLAVTVDANSARARRFLRDTEVLLELGNEVVARNVLGRGKVLKFPNVPPGGIRVRGINPRLRSAVTDVNVRPGNAFTNARLTLGDPGQF